MGLIIAIAFFGLVVLFLMQEVELENERNEEEKRKKYYRYK
jgi:hypothetical protein